MIRRIQETMQFFFLGIRLGATMYDRVRLAFFLSFGRVFSRATRTYKTFSITVFGHTFPIELTNDFGDAFVLSEVFSIEEYAMPKTIQPKVIFDLGANIGLTTLYFKARYPDAVIHAFEPDPDNFARLKRNSAQKQGVHAYPVAVCDTAGTRVFYQSPVFHMRNSLISRNSQDKKVEMRCITLSDAFNMAGVSTVDLCKFDIEGSEFEVFRTDTMFNHIRAMVGEVHPYLNPTYDEDAFLEPFRKHYTTVDMTNAHNKSFLKCHS